MANRDNLKDFFRAGDRPTESEFGSLIDNTVNVTDDKAGNTEIDAGTDNVKYVTSAGARRAARKGVTVNNVAADLTSGNIQLPATEVPLTFNTGLVRTGNVVKADTSQSISKLSNLTTNGYVKTSAVNGTLVVSATIPATDITGTALPTTITASSLTSFGAAPNIGAATGTSLVVSGAITSSAGALGYTTGNGGTVIQSTSKATAVTLNKLTGDITTANVALAAAGVVSFTLNNSTIAATDIIHLQHQSAGTFGAYILNGRTAAGSAVINIRNIGTTLLTEPIVIKFIIIKAVTS